MLIHVDLDKLEKHLRILERQLAQARQNTEFLELWRDSAAVDPNMDMALIDRQIHFMERQKQGIRAKQELLESIAAQLRRTNYQMEEKAASAENALKRLG